jgi:hypothetical protein
MKESEGPSSEQGQAFEVRIPAEGVPQNAQGSRLWHRPRWGCILAFVLPLALLAGLLWGALQPAMANQFGYALPGVNGLPSHFSYAQTDYFNHDLCAGADSCQPERASRWSQQRLSDSGIWPLKQIGSVFTLFGAAHPIMEPVNDPSMAGAGTPYAGSDLTPFILFVPDGSGSYFGYMRMGGP